jgi:RHS repeat-associated protein
VYGSDQNIALVFDENGNVNHRYLFGNGVDQIEADESNGTVLWALTDHLGSVRDVVDDSGTVLNHIVYDAFGGVTSQTDESVVFRYGYTAREFDAESGLQYNRARYLDSFTGKFISEDPISFQAGDPNLYRYVFNSPLNGTDPSGLQTASDEFPIFRIPPIPIPDLGQTLQDIGNGISEAGKTVERFLVPPAEAPTFPKKETLPTKQTIPQIFPRKKNEDAPYYPLCPTGVKDDPKGGSRMVAQFQNARENNATDQRTLLNSLDRGVRVGQVISAFLDLYFTNSTKSERPFIFPKSHYGKLSPLKPKAVEKGIGEMIDFVFLVQKGGGIMAGPIKTIRTYQWDDGDPEGRSARKGPNRGGIRSSGDYRIELENNAGYNLREL